MGFLSNVVNTAAKQDQGRCNAQLFQDLVFLSRITNTPPPIASSHIRISADLRSAKPKMDVMVSRGNFLSLKRDSIYFLYVCRQCSKWAYDKSDIAFIKHGHAGLGVPETSKSLVPEAADSSNKNLKEIDSISPPSSPPTPVSNTEQTKAGKSSKRNKGNKSKSLWSSFRF